MPSNNIAHDLPWNHLGISCAFYTKDHVYQGSLSNISLTGLTLYAPGGFEPRVAEATLGGCVIKGSGSSSEHYCEIDCSVIASSVHRLDLQFKPLNFEQIEFVRSLMKSDTVS